MKAVEEVFYLAILEAFDVVESLGEMPNNPQEREWALQSLARKYGVRHSRAIALEIQPASAGNLAAEAAGNNGAKPACAGCRIHFSGPVGGLCAFVACGFSRQGTKSNQKISNAIALFGTGLVHTPSQREAHEEEAQNEIHHHSHPRPDRGKT